MLLSLQCCFCSKVGRCSGAVFFVKRKIQLLIASLIAYMSWAQSQLHRQDYWFMSLLLFQSPFTRLHAPKTAARAVQILAASANASRDPYEST
jgi:hypothetical protein